MFKCSWKYEYRSYEPIDRKFRCNRGWLHWSCQEEPRTRKTTQVFIQFL